jgi:hypothetical protein
MPTTFACQASIGALPGCQINSPEGHPQGTTSSAVFFPLMNFQGEPFSIDKPQSIRRLNGDMSSLKVPLGYEVVLFEMEDMQGPSVVLSGEISDLFTYLFNDRARSLIYRSKIGESQTLSCIFFNPDFIGQEVFLPYGLSEPGKNILYGGSIRVPNGLRVTLTTLHGARFPYRQTHVFTSDSSKAPFIGDPVISVLVEMV